MLLVTQWIKPNSGWWMRCAAITALSVLCSFDETIKNRISGRTRHFYCCQMPNTHRAMASG